MSEETPESSLPLEAFRFGVGQPEKVDFEAHWFGDGVEIEFESELASWDCNVIGLGRCYLKRDQAKVLRDWLVEKLG